MNENVHNYQMLPGQIAGWRLDFALFGCASHIYSRLGIIFFPRELVRV